jgi:hypothetical protein
MHCSLTLTRTRLKGLFRERRHERELVDLPTVPVERCPRPSNYSGAGAALVVLPLSFRPACLASRFTCRHSARDFSSLALHACLAARAAARSSRRSLRRFMPCVCADAGVMPASTTTAAKTPTPLQKLILRCIRFSFGCSDSSFSSSLSKKQNRHSYNLLRGVRIKLSGCKKRGALCFRELRGANPQTGPLSGLRTDVGLMNS